MNREIKFRGKTINGNEWIYGPTISQGTIKRKANKWFMEVAENKWKGLQPNTLGQYTGFKDRNDKEIYEGDIIRDFHSFDFSGDFTKKIRGAYDVTQDKDEPIPVVSYFRNYAVEWGKRGSYILRNGSDQHPLCTRFRGVEVIGNIYDNPELLTK